MCCRMHRAGCHLLPRYCFSLHTFTCAFCFARGHHCGVPPLLPAHTTFCARLRWFCLLPHYTPHRTLPPPFPPTPTPPPLERTRYTILLHLLDYTATCHIPGCPAFATPLPPLPACHLLHMLHACPHACAMPAPASPCHYWSCISCLQPVPALPHYCTWCIFLVTGLLQLFDSLLQVHKLGLVTFYYKFTATCWGHERTATTLFIHLLHAHK